MTRKTDRLSDNIREDVSTSFWHTFRIK